jgi:DNA helicase-2/ATP-dependent DNA helicase PcrA
MDQILEGLNDEQRAAVLHDRGPLLVVAGAGTGKTQVITRRIAYLISRQRARPDQILALTFTEKAAREMEERLYELLGWQSFQVPVMTFNAFGAELLGRFATHIGRSVKGGLLNEMQKALLLAQHMEELDLKYYGFQADAFEFIEIIVGYIGRLQNAGVSPEAYERHTRELRSNPGTMNPLEIDEQEDLASLYVLYDQLKRRTGTFDYHDQLSIPLDILRSHQNLVDRLRAEFEYVLVDEYQDTNSVQDELLRCFIKANGNLFAVGDDDQAIYGFRGADINNILSFSQHFSVPKPAVLFQNYRSGQAILDSAYRLIVNNNPDRLESRYGINKQLKAQHNNGGVAYRQYETGLDEQHGVVDEIDGKIQRGEDPGSIAVLSATHAPLMAMAKLLRNRGLPYAISTTSNIFEQPEILGLWYLLKWIAMDIDESSMAHVVTGPYVKWTADQYRRLLETSRDQLVSIEEALRSQGTPAAKRLCAEIDEWRGWAKSLPVSRLVFNLVFENGHDVEWRREAETSGRMVRVFEDLQGWLEQLQDFETVENNATLYEYLRLFPKPPVLETSEPQGDVRGVQLLTVHAAKGLEFETVYLIGCTHRSWSKGRGSTGPVVPEGLTNSSELPPEHEYRRLMYVAATRARRNLFVSAPAKTAGGVKQMVSPLVEQLIGHDEMAKAASEAPGNSTDGKLLKVMTRLQQFYPLKEVGKDRKLPFETADGWLELSVTSLSNYEHCPFEFYLENVLQIKQPMGPQLAFGNLLHKAFELYYRGRLAGTPVTVDYLEGVIEEGWSDRGYERKEVAQNDRNLAMTTLRRFFDREEREQRKVLASEMPIKLVVPEVKLRVKGKIDAVFETVDGIQLRDFKTGRNKTDPEKLAKLAKTNFQLRTYALAYRELQNQLSGQVVLDYVVTGVEGAAYLTAAILRNHEDKLIQIAAKIRNGEFAPNASALHQCAAIKYYGSGETDELAESILNSESGS